MQVAVWASVVPLAAISVVAVRRERVRSARPIVRGLGMLALLCLTMVTVVLWPLFYVGADTYLGAVNPDYTASFQDNEFLWTHSVLDLTSPTNSYRPFESSNISASARF